MGTWTTSSFAWGLLFIASQSHAEQLLYAPAPESPIAVAGGPGNIAIADVDNDGRGDLLVACGQSKSVNVLLGQGDGRFHVGKSISITESPGEMLLGDVN